MQVRDKLKVKTQSEYSTANLLIPKLFRHEAMLDDLKLEFNITELVLFLKRLETSPVLRSSVVPSAA